MCLAKDQVLPFFPEFLGLWVWMIRPSWVKYLVSPPSGEGPRAGVRDQMSSFPSQHTGQQTRAAIASGDLQLKLFCIQGYVKATVPLNFDNVQKDQL